MGPTISQEAFDAWCPDSFAPITDEVVFIRLPFEVVTAYAAGWLAQFGGAGEVDCAQVVASREKLADLLAPHLGCVSRWLFVATDSPWVAVFVPNPAKAEAFFGLDSFLRYVFAQQPSFGELGGDEFNLVHMLARPRMQVEDDLIPIADLVNCPEEFFARAGDCEVRLRKLGINVDSTAVLGHCAYKPEVYGAESYRFTNTEGFSDIGVGQTWLADELPESYLYPSETDIVAEYIWDIFGFQDLAMLVDELQLHLFESDFYLSQAVLLKAETAQEVAARAAMTKSFAAYQRENGCGPDMIWADRQLP